MKFKVYFKIQDQKELVSFDDLESERGAGMARFDTKEQAEDFIRWLGYNETSNGIFCLTGGQWAFADIALDELSAMFTAVKHGINQRILQSIKPNETGV